MNSNNKESDLSVNLSRQNNSDGWLDTLFNNSMNTMLLTFLVIYLLAYLVFRVFMKSENYIPKIYRVLDVSFIGILILNGLITFYFISQANLDIIQNIKTNIENVFENSYTIVHSIIFLIVFNLVLLIFRIPINTEDSPLFVSLLMNGAIIVLILSSIAWFFSNYLGISIFDNSIWSMAKKSDISGNALVKGNVDISVNTLVKGNVAISGNTLVKGNVAISVNTTKSADNHYDVYKPKNEVFNISNNLYTYEDARAICTAYGARLATYDEVEESYNKGGEWCNYGWSEDQLALFPTQKLTWFKLQRNPNHKNDCGRPGVNGGYMSNPYIRFGVNCYGKKPDPTEKDKSKLNYNIEDNIPKTPEEMILDKKVEFWKENSEKLLNLNSFNYNKWSEY
jgi:hypothetical protein